jgi:hypothetical protein
MKTTKQIIEPYKDDLKDIDKLVGSYDNFLIEKWEKRIPPGWYGFEGINELWGKIIDEFLTELEKIAPNFEINQIKLKWGGLRFYVETNVKEGELDQEINKEISELEDALFHKKLIY